ncbi:hypothetical protein Acsp06_03340 [Actinomycetospora sp. NBRC 106375]|uniref:DUF6084 family protein n=1 Tax=Actinomycetospora sp. NBRC 106375 TaxID=3032207 RepID=UPI0024A1D99A|nr:DUF6084 family protein [Actinomycetospora sp. NBRC 106375]GLZ44149.1 hypothetical protein Acsp06_03340 [Actinomycetospora sp. NBRC 106375]
MTLPFPRPDPGPELRFAVTGADHDASALTPTLRLHLTVTETTGTRIHALALRTQIRIEPARRRYAAEEQARLVEVFGDPERWGRTLNPMQLATVATVTPGFAGEHRAVLEVPLTSDAEIASTRYLRGLDAGEIPLLLLFSGTVFYDGGTGVQVGLVPWSSEAAFRLPVAVWTAMMTAHYGGTTWLPLPARTFDALAAWRAARALPSWEQTVDALLERDP